MICTHHNRPSHPRCKSRCIPCQREHEKKYTQSRRNAQAREDLIGQLYLTADWRVVDGPETASMG